MTMTQAEREEQVKWLDARLKELWREIAAMEVEAARSGGTPCVDQMLLREWGNKVFAIRAGVGPLA